MLTIADPRAAHTTHRASPQHRGPWRTWGNLSPGNFIPLLLMTANAVARARRGQT